LGNPFRHLAAIFTQFVRRITPCPDEFSEAQWWTPAVLEEQKAAGDPPQGRRRQSDTGQRTRVAEKKLRSHASDGDLVLVVASANAFDPTMGHRLDDGPMPSSGRAGDREDGPDDDWSPVAMSANAFDPTMGHRMDDGPMPSSGRAGDREDGPDDDWSPVVMSANAFDPTMGHRMNNDPMPDSEPAGATHSRPPPRCVTGSEEDESDDDRYRPPAVHGSNVFDPTRGHESHDDEKRPPTSSPHVSDDDWRPATLSAHAFDPTMGHTIDCPPQMSRATALGWRNPFAPDCCSEDFQVDTYAPITFD
jgi:hypothetical protein